MSTPHELWESILKTAILGTDRQSLDEAKSQIEIASDSASQLVAQLDLSARESFVLSAAAILTLHKRAGKMPTLAGETRLQTCAVDATPRCNAAASTRLAGLLQQVQSPLLAEWLQLAARHNLRVSEEYLPDLLDAGKRNSELRAAIAGVLGQRGRWLASQNPEWSYGVAVSQEQLQNDEIWETGNKAERLSFFKIGRQRDANGARELLAKTWKQEPPAERAEFLEIFAENLSLADEEFLENALDDKRREVRKTAADLLSQLPESRLVARHFERLKTILKVTSAGKLQGLLGRGSKIEIELPTEFDKAMARDGIEEKTYGGGAKGPKAGWVGQMLAVVPPTFWEREWNLGAREIVRASGAGEWKDVLLHGFVKAASRHKTIAWLEILNEEMQTEQSHFDAQILSLLPDETKERFIMTHLKTGAFKHKIDSRFSQALHYHQKPWSSEFSRFLLDVAREVSKSPDSQQHWLRYSLKSWAFWIPTELYEEAAKGWPQQSAHWESWELVVNEFLGVLQMRCEMRRELKES